MENYIRHQRNTAFTLIEMSVVLMIIGLIVGGILVGGEMIKAAEMRRLVSQMESYSTAVQIFREKYNNYPGDGLEISAFFPGAVNGNGNGMLECEDIGGGAETTGLSQCTYSGEYATFWMHLSEASFIEGKYNGSVVAGQGFPMTTNHRGIIAYYQPQSSIFRIPEHRFAIGAMNTLSGSLSDTTGGTIQGIAPTFSYMEASTIDRKWDDGMPRTGAVTVFGVSSCGPSCTSFSTPQAYTFPNMNSAQLRLYFKMSGW